ncbi:putative PLAC8 motif-containing protein [Helianthus annuus]|nr:putative PLAC8 motif-containing protein [Helianthus annuus]
MDNNGVEDKKSSGFRTSFSGFTKLDIPKVKFQRLERENDESSSRVNNGNSNSINNSLFRRSVRRVLGREIDYGLLKNMAREWIKNPMNMVLLLWIVCVAISGAILFLVMTGMLNHALPKKSQRNAWFEVNNQILNALFTLMCLYQHPHRLYHLVLLLRWRSEDVTKLRKVYCKNASSKPHEWAHMMVVVFLLNLNCFAQYALCGLNVGYKRSERPAIGVALTVTVAIGAPAIAGVYSVISPLGKDYDTGSDEESQLRKDDAESSTGSTRKILGPSERRFSFALKEDSRTIVSSPKWSGGVFDFWEDISLAYLSLFCSCCVFGWNMERLGFGNMYVHIATFLLFCLAPFWIFNLAAINIDNETVREILGITGMFLCLFGLLYGGFWRIQMRKRFNLPPSDFCFGKPAVTDCALWLCCCWCSLAQEVRTGNAYDIVEDGFYNKNESESGGMTISPLPRERDQPSALSSPSLSRYMKDYQNANGHLSMAEEDSSNGNDAALEPPVPSRIRRDES